MAHVDELDATYAACRRWIKPDGFMAHAIDFSSHNLFKEWNGHWACPELVWKTHAWKKRLSHNRVPYSEHVRLLALHGFEVVGDQVLQRVDGLMREDFVPEFRSMSVDDANTQLASLSAGRLIKLKPACIES